MTLFRKNSIANKLILYIFLFSSFVTLILSTIELTSDYNSSIKSLKDRVEQIRDSHLKTLALRLWTLDEEGLESQLNGIIQLPDIEYAKVIDTTQLENKGTNGKTLFAGKVVSKNIIENEFSLVHNISNHEMILGKLIIISGLDNIYDKLVEKIIFVLLSNAAKIFLVSLFIFFIIQSLITRHLVKIADYTDNMDEEGRSKPLNLFNKQSHDSKVFPGNELDRVVTSINNMNLKLREYSGYQKLVAISQIAYQVAHDIRSPLTALDVAVSSTSELPEEKRVLIRNAVSRIRDIANHLVYQSRSAEAKKDGASEDERKTEEHAICLLPSLIDELITEKRLQHRSKMNIEIAANFDKDSYGLFANIQPVEFKRVFSNLVNNAVESLGEKGSVTVGLKSNNGNILLTMMDTGKGIPSDIVPKLMQRGTTYGKKGGSGLGLHHARTTVESWGGSVKIESEVGKGTTITLTLPKESFPDWFVPKLELRSNSIIVILDDDISIHQIWQDRLDSLQAKERHVEIKHVSTLDEFRQWFESSNKENVRYLFDYELIGQKRTGLELIEEFKIARDSILVTSRYEESEIMEKCRQLRVRLIPKPMAGVVPIEILETAKLQGEKKDTKGKNQSKPDLILIDDDDMIHLTWKMLAKSQNKEVKMYLSPDDFLKEADQFDKSTPIFIDSNLGDNTKGEDVSKQLHDLGFTNLYLATGYSPDNFSTMTWLKGIVGKEGPWKT